MIIVSLVVIPMQVSWFQIRYLLFDLYSNFLSDYTPRSKNYCAYYLKNKISARHIATINSYSILSCVPLICNTTWLLTLSMNFTLIDKTRLASGYRLLYLYKRHVRLWLGLFQGHCNGFVVSNWTWCATQKPFKYTLMEAACLLHPWFCIAWSRFRTCKVVVFDATVEINWL